MSATVKWLLTSRRIWTCVLAIAQTVLFQYVPHFPPAVWQALDGLAVVLIAGLTVDDAVATAVGVNHLTGELTSAGRLRLAARPATGHASTGQKTG